MARGSHGAADGRRWRTARPACSDGVRNRWLKIVFKQPLSYTYQLSDSAPSTRKSFCGTIGHL